MRNLPLQMTASLVLPARTTPVQVRSGLALQHPSSTVVVQTASSILVLLNAACVMRLTILVCYSPVPLYTFTYSMLASVQRGTKRNRAEQNDPPTPVESRFRARIATGGTRRNEDFHTRTIGDSRQNADRSVMSASDMFRFVLPKLSAVELEMIVKDGIWEMDRRNGTV